MKAQALWLTAPRAAEFRTEQLPLPGPGQIRARTIASALSQGTEILVYRGQIPKDLPLDLPTLQGSFAFPIKYGYAAVGEITDIGPGVDNLSPGDVVFALHPHQSAFVAPASLAMRLPSGFDPTLGVFAANVETALNVLMDTPIQLGEVAIVFGLGTVGLLIAQLLKRAGAGKVIGVDPLTRRRDVALAVGADTALSPGDDLPRRIRNLAAYRGADVAIEASGAGAALQAAIEAVEPEGTVVVVSWYGNKPVTLQLGGNFHRGRLRLISSQVGAIAPALAPRWDKARRSALVAELLPQLHLSELISHRIPFSQAPEAYRLVDERPEEVTQVVLTYT